MKVVPKFLEIRDENEAGSVLHRCAPGGIFGILKTWMERQPTNCGKSTSTVILKDAMKNVGGGTVTVKNGRYGVTVLNTYHIKYMERPDTLVVIPKYQCKRAMKLVDESQRYRTVSQLLLYKRSKLKSS